jgi:hypothetical protein
MMSVPSSVVQYVNDYSPHPSGLIGCHAASGQKPYSCCEYDIAIFCENRKVNLNRVITLSNITIEFIQFPLLLDERHCIDLKDMMVLKDHDCFLLSSLLANLREKKYDQLLKLHGKRQIIESLFLFDDITKNLSKHPLLSSLWLKISAYHFIKGILAICGIKSSPVHELEQVRSLQVRSPEITSGLNSALDCIGIERAGRSAISRSLKVIRSLDKSEVSKMIWLTKSQWLLSQGRVADTYYYIGRMAAEYLLSKDETFLIRYLKPIGMLLDLTTDQQSIHRLHAQLMRASKDALRT